MPRTFDRQDSDRLPEKDRDIDISIAEWVAGQNWRPDQHKGKWPQQRPGEDLSIADVSTAYFAAQFNFRRLHKVFLENGITIEALVEIVWAAAQKGNLTAVRELRGMMRVAAISHPGVGQAVRRCHEQPDYPDADKKLEDDFVAGKNRNRQEAVVAAA